MINERTGKITRTTRETDIDITVSLDGNGKAEIDTGIGFFDHMLTALSVHSGISMSINVKGDLHVDGHHTVEDTGIALGQALAAALGNKSGIKRYGTSYIPMDESLAMTSLDISNRPFLVFNAEFNLSLISSLIASKRRTPRYARSISNRIPIPIPIKQIKIFNKNIIYYSFIS